MHNTIILIITLKYFNSTYLISIQPDDVFVSTRGYGALEKLSAERPEAVVQIVLALAAIEVFSLFKDGQGEGTGDLGFDPLNLKGFFKLQEGDNLEQMQVSFKDKRYAISLYWWCLVYVEWCIS